MNCVAFDRPRRVPACSAPWDWRARQLASHLLPATVTTTTYIRDKCSCLGKIASYGHRRRYKRGVTLTVIQIKRHEAEIHRVVQAINVNLTVNTNQTTPIKLKFIESFRLESEQYSILAAKIHHLVFFYYFDISSVTLTVNTNLTRPLKTKSIKPFRLQSVPNNYTYIHTLEKHPSFWRCRFLEAQLTGALRGIK
ncbi:hypothetical protein SFRURICE_010614 [Spodoptera frugiperda]|nr:hypothetical protein SFRURICE_010614 [Spodoptera frugiperda]